MIYLKVVGCGLVALSGVAISASLNKRCRCALRCAESWERLFAHIKNQVECFSLPIGEILSRIEPTLLRQCGYSGRTTPTDISELVRGTLFADGETARIAESFASEFGKCYKREQVSRCEYFIALAEERRKKLSAELPSKIKLYATLSAATSLGVIILFV